jgi:ketosteroid isomerase-like protein
MGHPNEEPVRRAYDAFSKGDIETLRQQFSDDAVRHAAGHHPPSTVR